MRWLAAALLAAVSLCAPALAGAQTDTYAAADSADLADEALAGLDPADVSDVTDAIADAVAERARRRGDLRTEIVRGYRRSERLTAVVRRVALGARRQDGQTAQWLDVRPGGRLQRITVGGMRLRCGEGLVVGATRSRFGSTRTAASTELTAGPSLTLSRPLEGIAVAARAGHARASFAGWTREDAGDGRWGSLGVETAAGAVAVSAGSLPGAGGAISVAAACDLGGCDVATEVARVAGTTLALVRGTVRAAGRWTAAVFQAGGDASGGVIEIDDDSARERGAALWCDGAVAGWDATLRLYAVRRRSDDDRVRRRRVDARATRVTALGLRYRLSARLDLDEKTSVPSGRLATGPEMEATRRGRLRARVDIPAGPSTSLRYQVDSVLEAAARPGFVSGFEVCVAGRRGDVRASTTNVALPGAGGGIVSRPGIAGYETVSTAGRNGSDLSLRATVYLGSQADLGLYLGAPWQRATRCLLALRVAL